MTDTKQVIANVPPREASDEAWRNWANSYPTLRSSGLECYELGPGSARFALDGDTFPPNPNGAVNGGVVALAIDQAMGVVALRNAPTGSVPVTASLTVQFHLPAFPPLELDARIVPGGRYIQSVEVTVRDVDGERCCTAVGTMAVGSADGRGFGRPDDR